MKRNFCIAIFAAMFLNNPGMADELKPAAWIPLPAIGSSPETGFQYGVYAMRLFPQTAVDVPQNRLALLLQGTTKNQYQAYLWPDIYIDHGHWQIQGTLGVKYWPAGYYGQGNESPDVGDKYSDMAFESAINLNRHVTTHLKLGGSVIAEHHRIKDIDENPTTVLLTSTVSGYDGGLYSGIGLRGEYDTRDNIDWPSQGSLVQARLDAFTTILGSDTDFTTGQLSLAHYTSMGQNVLAISGQIASASKNSPFTHLPKPEGSRSLRGAVGSRWIDKQALGLQAEYRKTLGHKWATVAFLDSFQVASKFSDMQLENFHYSPGIGLRYAMTPDRFNIRFDIASVDLDGISLAAVTVSEAF